MQAFTFRLDHDIDPIAFGARSGLLWTHGGFSLAGMGEVARIDPRGAAQMQLAELAGRDEVLTAGTGPVAFGALPFDTTAAATLLVPEIVVGRNADGRRWITVVADGPVDVAAAVSRVQAVSQRPVPSGPQPTRYDMISALTPEQWRDDVLTVGRNRVRAGELRKVVLARRVDVRTDHPVDTAIVVERLRQTFGSAIVFCIDGFVGASPELLVSRLGDVVRAHPLAGTAPRSSEPAADARLAAALVASSKDRWEHRITIDWLLENLLPFCSYVDAEAEPSIVSLANVHHLGTLVEGRLSHPAASVLELVDALHPTPAVGGDPQALAVAMIGELERTGRGNYAGPTGWVDAAGNGAFAVGLRSGQFTPEGATVFAGVGVVADSDPEAELAETRSKFQAILGALLRP